MQQLIPLYPYIDSFIPIKYDSCVQNLQKGVMAPHPYPIFSIKRLLPFACVKWNIKIEKQKKQKKRVLR